MSRIERIRKILFNNLHPSYINIDNESYKHDIADVQETHIKIIIVSDEFILLSRINRHKQVNNLLISEFQSGMHALSLHLYTQEEWSNLPNKNIETPACNHLSGV